MFKAFSFFTIIPNLVFMNIAEKNLRMTQIKIEKQKKSDRKRGKKNQADALSIIII